MSKEIMYLQCSLEKPTPTGVLKRMSWIPEKFAVEGTVVKMKESNGEWNDGWTVKSASGNPLPESFVVHQSHAHTRQRKASDI